MWWGGEYQHPLGERFRLRLGGRRIAPGILGETVRSELSVGAYRPALAGRPQHRGEPPCQRPPTLDRQCALLPGPGRPPGSQAQAHPADNVDRTGLLAPPPVPEIGVPRWPGLRSIAQRRMGDNAHHQGGGGGRIRKRTPEDGALAERHRLGAAWAPRSSCRSASPWAAAASSAGRSTKAAGATSRRAASRAIGHDPQFSAPRSTTAPSPPTASARNWW